MSCKIYYICLVYDRSFFVHVSFFILIHSQVLYSVYCHEQIAWVDTINSQLLVPAASFMYFPNVIRKDFDIALFGFMFKLQLSMSPLHDCQVPDDCHYLQSFHHFMCSTLQNTVLLKKCVIFWLLWWSLNCSHKPTNSQGLPLFPWKASPWCLTGAVIVPLFYFACIKCVCKI